MKLNNLTLSYGNKIVIDNIDLEINSGEFVFIIGYSGSGKTSLIKSLIGDFEPSSGTVVLDNGSLLYNGNDNYLTSYRRKIGIIFQDYKLLESKTVYENVAFAMEVSGYKDEVISSRVPEILDRVGLLVKKDNYITELSGGEKQRVAIARALVHNPEIIIGDEPTGNLDPETAMSIMEIFKELNHSGITIIIATHDKNIVDKYNKRVVTFRDKKIFSDEKKGKYDL